MGDFDNIGKLMHLPVTDIESEEKIYDSDFIINAAADFVLQTGGRNWVPVIVKEIGEYRYQVVSNYFVYSVAKKANLERVWCIVIEPDNPSIEQAKILAKEEIPKVNISTASREIILAALEYLINEPGNGLSSLKGKIVTVAEKIIAADRETWSSLNPIATLKCGITKTKLDVLSKVFFALPPKPSTPTPPVPEVVSIKRASRDEISIRLSYLSNHKIGGFETINPEQVADIIFTASKSKWKSLNPISKLECGIDSAKIKTLKKVFTL